MLRIIILSSSRNLRKGFDQGFDQKVVLGIFSGQLCNLRVHLVQKHIQRKSAKVNDVYCYFTDCYYDFAALYCRSISCIVISIVIAILSIVIARSLLLRQLSAVPLFVIAVL